METNENSSVDQEVDISIPSANESDLAAPPISDNSKKDSTYEQGGDVDNTANTSGSESHTATLLGQELDLIMISDNLMCPRAWADEAFTHPQLQNAITFLSRLSPCALSVRWLISSMSKDLTGNPRSDSKDHSSGLALDIAPMYSDDEVLPADPPMAGLAWNLKSLLVLSQGQYGDLPLFIEGDHVHFSSSINPSKQGTLPLMWSTSTAYQSAQSEEQDPILMALRNSFWMWDTSTLTLSPPTKQTYDTISRLLNMNQSASADQN